VLDYILTAGAMEAKSSLLLFSLHPVLCMRASIFMVHHTDFCFLFFSQACQLACALCGRLSRPERATIATPNGFIKPFLQRLRTFGGPSHLMAPTLSVFITLSLSMRSFKDHNLQMDITELFWRVTGAELRAECAQQCFPGPVAALLLAIRGSHFDADAARFLKDLNNLEPTSQRSENKEQEKMGRN
jgi:hypothetical protein